VFVIEGSAAQPKHPRLSSLLLRASKYLTKFSAPAFRGSASGVI
jgi:hypothetical protein